MSTKKKKPQQTPAVQLGKVYNFCGKKKMIAVIGIVVIVALIVGIIIRGDNRSIEFKGGTIKTYTYEEGNSIDKSKVKDIVSTLTSSKVTVREGEDAKTGAPQFTINLRTGNFDIEKQNQLTLLLQQEYPDHGIIASDATTVTSSTGNEFLLKCVIAVIFAAIMIIIYVAIRFRKIGGWSAGACSVLALFQDLVTAMAVSYLFGFEFSANTVAVILTILGYSINNTIVIYDRIRENRRLMPKATLNELINTGCTQSLTRSIRTSITTISTMLIITVVVMIKGYDSLLSFSVPLMAGLISGTYTSLFVAPVTWSWWKGKEAKKDAPAKA